MLQSGDIAPDFTAKTTTGETVSLHDFQGKKNVVLFFYPKDDTPGCTREACEFRDTKEDYDAADTVIFGISTDDQAAHRDFTDKYGLNFPLLVDSDETICNLYGVELRGGLASRVTFLIGTDGRIRRSWEQVVPAGHAAEVFEEIKGMTQ